jgi:hypothetical protein
MSRARRYFAAEISHGVAQRHHWSQTATQSSINVEQAVQRALDRLCGQHMRLLRLHSVSFMPIVLSSGTEHESTWCLVGVIAEDVEEQENRRGEEKQSQP